VLFVDLNALFLFFLFALFSHDSNVNDAKVQMLNRVQEVPQVGAFCDLMWSDPEEVEGWELSTRGAGYLFGSAVTSQVIFGYFSIRVSFSLLC
jgi:diadenosine tetraphosphatase ApaH/serine/threonine PP2A family protein phosphatase